MSLCTFVACEPNENNIGHNIIASGSYITCRDTLFVTAATSIQDSIASSNITDKQTVPIGFIYDPVLGKTSSALATTFGLSTDNPEFDETVVVDSVVLSLSYAQSPYGDPNCFHTLRVYELREVLSGNYYSNHRCAYSPIELGSRTFMPTYDSVVVEGKLVMPSIQIPLDKSLGERVVNADSSYLASDTSFVNLLNGIYIVADPVNTPNSGSIMRFYLEEDMTYIKIYYHNSQKDSLSYKLNITSELKRYVEYDHFDYSDAAPELLNALDNPLAGEEKLYLQAMSGLRVKLDINGLDSIAQLGTIAVSNAVIKFHLDSDETFFTTPTKFDLVRINPDSTATIISDYSVSTSHYDGNLDTKTSVLSFRIASQLQQYFYGSAENYGLYLVLRNSSYEPARTVFYGSKPEDLSKRIMIDMTYSIVVPE